MIVRPLIGLAVACSLAGCTGASELAESEPAAISSPPAPSAAAAPSIAPAASDGIVHVITDPLSVPPSEALTKLVCSGSVSARVSGWPIDWSALSASV